MISKTIPLLLLSTGTATAMLPTTEQPESARLVQRYAQQLPVVGVSRVVSPGNGEMVRLETAFGPVYVRYPAQAPTLVFVLDVGPDGLRANSATFNQAQDEQVLAALLPEALKVTAANNRVEWLRANPWH